MTIIIDYFLHPLLTDEKSIINFVTFQVSRHVNRSQIAQAVRECGLLLFEPKTVKPNLRHLAMDHLRSKRYFINPWLHGKNESIEFSPERWFENVSELVNLVLSKQPPVINTEDSGLYVGSAGIAYMLLHVSNSPAFASQKGHLLSKGLEYIKAALLSLEEKPPRRVEQPAFLLGPAGIYAVGAALHNAIGNENDAQNLCQRYASLSSICCPVDFFPNGGDELFVGRSGYICGALWLQKIFGQPIVPTNDLYRVCQSIIASGRQYAQRTKSQSPLMYSYYQTEYLGAAHGLCAILQMLISVPGFLQTDPSAERDVRGSVDFLLAVQTSEGNFPCATDEIRSGRRRPDDELVHWCHGAPGVVYLMAKAYILWQEERYLQSCIRCADLVWEKGLLCKGPGLCHGVAGSGYVFLLLFRLTQNPCYLQQAQYFAHFLHTEEFRAGARSPDCPYSLYEGLAGTACFISDLLHPMDAAFPFMDVF